MEPGVDAIFQSGAVKDSSQKPKLLEDLLSSLLIPETPIRKTEKTENSKLDLKCISSQVAVSDEEDDDENPRTPKETVLDPFVNGSEHLEDPYGKISRHLHFELARIGKCDADPVEEEEEEEKEEVEEESLLGSILSENLLDAILSEQADKLLLLPDADTDAPDEDGFKTPTMSSVCGIAESCPAAPRKPAVARTLKIMDSNLCKKLQF